MSNGSSHPLESALSSTKPDCLNLVSLRVTAQDIRRPVFVKGYGEGLLLFWGIYQKTGRPRAGVAFNRPIGLNNGTIEDFVYFRCPPKHGVLVEPVKVSYLSQGATEAALRAGLLLDPKTVGHVSGKEIATLHEGTASKIVRDYATVPVRSGPLVASLRRCTAPSGILIKPNNPLASLLKQKEVDSSAVNTSNGKDDANRKDSIIQLSSPSASPVALDTVSISSSFSIVSMTPLFDEWSAETWSMASRASHTSHTSSVSTCSSVCSSICQDFVQVGIVDTV